MDSSMLDQMKKDKKAIEEEMNGLGQNGVGNLIKFDTFTRKKSKKSVK